MARFRLMQPHYLNVPGTEWEYKETNQQTGKQGRKTFAVPMYLRPDDESDHNYPGEIIVFKEGSEGKPGPKDIVFIGDPTPDMEPLDPEAEALVEAFAPSWKHPIENVDGGYSQSMLNDFQKQLSEALANAKAAPASPASTAGVDPNVLAQVQEQMAQLMAANAEMKEELDRIRANASQALAEGKRRSV